MSTALVLAADGRRGDGRWKRGSVIGNPDSGTTGKAWQNALNQAGTVLDHAPDLAVDVAAGDMALDASRCGSGSSSARRLPTGRRLDRTRTIQARTT